MENFSGSGSSALFSPFIIIIYIAITIFYIYVY